MPAAAIITQQMEFSPEAFELSESRGQRMRLDAFLYLVRHL